MADLTLERIAELERLRAESDAALYRAFASRSAVDNVAHENANLILYAALIPDLPRLLALARRALEQPAPTGELTDVHVSLATAALYRNWPSLKSWPVLELLNRVAQLLATREASAYQRGLLARGEWVTVGGAISYLRAELVQYGEVTRRRVARALELLEALPKPPEGGEL